MPQLDPVGVAGLLVQVEGLAPFRKVPSIVVHLCDVLFGACVDDEIGPGLVNVLIPEYLDGFD